MFSVWHGIEFLIECLCTYWVDEEALVGLDTDDELSEVIDYLCGQYINSKFEFLIPNYKDYRRMNNTIIQFREFYEN